MKIDFDKELLNEFIIESNEHLSSMEQDLLLLEKQGPDMDCSLIDKVFRAVHSIKGSAGFLGLKKISEISHTMETILQMIRSKELIPERKMIDSLLAGIDKLHIMLNDIEKSENVDIQKVHDKLCSLLAKAVSPKIKAEINNSLKLFDINGKDADFEVSEFAFNRRPGNHEHLYVLNYDLSEMNRKNGISPVALVKELISTGEILDSRLSSTADNLEEDLSMKALLYKVLYSTVLESDLITSAAKLPMENIKEIMTDRTRALEKKEIMQNEIKIDIEEIKPEAQQNNSNSNHSDTVRINVDILDKLMTLAGELVLVRNQHLMAFSNTADTTARGISQRLDIVTTELQETIMKTRMQPMGNVFSKLPRIVRDLAQKLNKKIEIKITGDDVELDKTLLESLSDPLVHIIRNCCDHGIETAEEREKNKKKPTGSITVKAFHDEGQISIQIKDDGRGLDIEKIKEKAIKNGLKSKDDLALMSEKDIIMLITLPGFSTAEKVSDISGRGVGMDVVKTSIEKLGGTLEITSKAGTGTTITLTMPLTLAIIPCLIVMVQGERFAIPQINIEELVCLYGNEMYSKIEIDNNQEVYRLRDMILPIVRLSEVISRRKTFSVKVKNEISEKYRNPENQKTSSFENLTVTVVKSGNNRFGLIIDKVTGTEEIVVKPMHAALKNINIYSGATVMGDGKCSMILDADGLVSHAGIDFAEIKASEMTGKTQKKSSYDTQAVMLFKYGLKEQFAVALPLIKRIEKINRKNIEEVGAKEYININNISTNIIRLDEVFKISPCPDQEEYFLLLPKHARTPSGLLISSLIDIVNIPSMLDTETYKQDGILSTAVIRERMTLFPDIYRVIELLNYECSKKRESGKDDKKKKILLVEDALFFRQLVKGYLESGGFDVTIAENGKEALNLFKSSDFDMIVSDLEMPEMDGWDFMRKVRAEKANGEVPAIALTALETESEKVKAFEAGYNNFQVKIDREGLLNTISGFFIKE